MGAASNLDDGAGVHPTAILDEGAAIGAGTAVGPYCHIGPGSKIGAACRLHDHVIVAGDVTVGDRCTVSSGVFLQAGITLGDDVVVGPNATFVESGFGRGDRTPAPAPTSIRDGASIGANASVLAGVTVGSHAVVGAGAVVTRDVPPFAIVVGSPARIVGYQATPRFTATNRLRASTLRDDDFPMSIGRAELSRHPLVEDLRGFLTFGEVPTHLPFVPHRYFLVFGVSSREVRGEHAHRECHQLLICVHGECAVAIDDGADRGEVMLDRPDVALHLPPMVWGSQYRYSPDAVLLVLASHAYRAEDYIRDYDEFVEELARG